MTVIEVFADVACPFTHVGLRRFVERRDEIGRPDVLLHMKSWPLEVVNGTPLDAGFIADEVAEIRRQVAPTLFVGFDQRSFPRSSLHALTLAAAAYRASIEVGERMSLALRELLFEDGVDIGDDDVLVRIARDNDLHVDLTETSPVHDEHAQGVARGVVGSPHFFTPEGGFFCPSLDVQRNDDGHLHITSDPAAFDEFIDACFA